MKQLLLTAFFTFAGVTAVAAPSANYFQCSGYEDVEENTVTIDLTAGTASFFDNDNTYEMRLVSSRILETMPPSMLSTFEGDDFRVSFTADERSQQAALYYIDPVGDVEDLGTMPCKPARR